MRASTSSNCASSSAVEVEVELEFGAEEDEPVVKAEPLSEEEEEVEKKRPTVILELAIGRRVIGVARTAAAKARATCFELRYIMVADGSIYARCGM